MFLANVFVDDVVWWCHCIVEVLRAVANGFLVTYVPCNSWFGSATGVSGKVRLSLLLTVSFRIDHYRWTP